MYEIDLILIYPIEYKEKFEVMIGAVESATNHYIPRKRLDRQSEISMGISTMSRIDKISSKETPVQIKRNLLLRFADLKIIDVIVSVKGKKIKFWEEHAKSIAFFLGLTSLIGLIIGVSAWMWPKLLIDLAQKLQ